MSQNKFSHPYKHHYKIALKIFLGVFLLLLATAPAISWWGDSKEACLSAHSWVNTGKPTHFDDNGQPIISIRPLLFTLMCMPTATLLPLPDPEESPYTRLGRAVIPALFGAGCAAIFFLILIHLGIRSRPAILIGLALVFATPVWIYSRLQYSEIMQLFINLALLLILIREKTPGRMTAILSGCLVGMLINIRSTNALVIPFVALYFAICHKPWRIKAQTISWFTLGLIPWLLAWVEFNQIRYGSPWMTGYESVSVWHNPLNGFVGQLFSPGKSIFVFAPLTLIGAILFCVRTCHMKAVEKISPRSQLLLAFLITNLLLYSSWWAWSGGWAWGPRFLIPFLPIFLLPVAQALNEINSSRVIRRTIYTASLVGFCVQIPVAIVGVHTLLQFLGLIDRAAFNTTPQFGAVGDDMILANFVPEFSPVIVQFRLFREMLEHIQPFTVDFSEWAAPNGPFRVPGFEGREVLLDPIQPDLWFISEKSPNPALPRHGTGAWFMALSLALAGFGFLFAIFRKQKEYSPDQSTEN